MVGVGSCIASNPDISGIGVRTAIYAQNILSFAPAVFALLDKEVSPTELDTLETQSTTILITAFAILVSTIVQGLTEGVTNYHAAIILNLSWMNNTNLFIYFLLYVHHRAGLRAEGGKHDEAEGGSLEGKKSLGKDSGTKGGKAGAETSKECNSGSQAKGDSHLVVTNLPMFVKEAKRALKNPVFIIGSIHLTFMAAVGIWLWSRPGSFGHSSSCSSSAILVILGKQVSLGSAGLRYWSLLVYSVLLLPILNLVVPIIFFLGPIALYNRLRPKSSPHLLSIAPIVGGLAVLAVVNIIVLADTEITIRKNRHLLLDGGDTAWTFGQTLALLLLLVPLRDLGETLLERRPRKVGKKLLNASADGKLEVVEHLLKQGPATIAKGGSHMMYGDSITHATGDSSLRAAATNGHVEIAKVLIDHGASVHSKGSDGQTSLHLAAALGHTNVLVLLIRRGACKTTPDRSGQIAVDLALAGMHNEGIVLLLGGDFELDRHWHWKSALNWAVDQQRLDIIKTLIRHGANPNREDDNGDTPLKLAIQAGNSDIVHYLVENGADVDKLSGTHPYRSPLHIAAERGRFNIVKYLVGRGANVDAVCWENTEERWYRNRPGYTALCLAEGGGHMDIVRYFVKLNIHQHDVTYLGIGLRLAAVHGHIEMVQYLAELGADVDVKDRSGSSALKFAVKYKKVDLLLCLVKHGAEVNMYWSEREIFRTTTMTPLNEAIDWCCFDAVKCLVDHGAKLKIHGSDHFHPLLLAVKMAVTSENTDILRYLLEKGVDANDKDDLNVPTISAAIQAGPKHLDVIELLASHGADLNKSEQDTLFPLARAVRFGWFDTVQCLIKHGANVNQINDEWGTALCLAAYDGHSNIAKFLVQSGADLNIQTPQSSQTPLHFAVKNRRHDIVKFLLECGADMEVDSDYGAPLYIAARDWNMKGLQLLLERGANVNVASGKYLNTPLHVAARQNNMKMAQCLVKHGADLTSKNTYGKTALENTADRDRLQPNSVYEFLRGLSA